MSRLLGSIYGDNQCLRGDGTSGYGYRQNPDYKNDSVGSFEVWVRIPVLLTATGNIPLFCLAPADVSGSDIFFVSARRHPGFSDTGTHFDVLSTVSGAVQTKGNPNAIPVSTWRLLYLDSSGVIAVNGTVISSPVTWNGTAWTGRWFNAISATNKDAAFCATRRNGSVLNYGQCDLNQPLFYDRPLTSTEIAARYAASMSSDPRRLPFLQPDYSGYATLRHGYGFEGSGRDDYGSEPLTMVSPTYTAP